MFLKKLLLPVSAILVLGVSSLVSSSDTNIQYGDCTVMDTSVDQQEAQFLALLNQHRAELGKPPLSISHSLNKTATWKARDMAVNNYFSHTDSTGRDPFTLQRACGYLFNTWRGENILVGTDNAATTLQYWVGSAGHEAVQTDSNFKQVGIARVQGYYGEWLTWYWSASFGGEKEPLPCPDFYPVDGKITIQDLLSFSFPVRHFGTKLGDIRYDYKYDRDADLDIDIQDVISILPLNRIC